MAQADGWSPPYIYRISKVNILIKYSIREASGAPSTFFYRKKARPTRQLWDADGKIVRPVDSVAMIDISAVPPIGVRVGVKALQSVKQPINSRSHTRNKLLEYDSWIIQSRRPSFIHLASFSGQSNPLLAVYCAL